MMRIPFTLPDVGLREIKGVVYLERPYLVLEMEDALVGEFDKDFHTLKVEPGALKEVGLLKGAFRDKLVLRPKTPELLQHIPGDHAREVQLRIWRKHRGDVRRLIGELERITLYGETTA